MEVNNPYPYTDETLPVPEYPSDSETLPPTQLEPTPETLTVQENAFAKEAVEKRPEAVQSHVEIAAEQGKPLEAVYEKRHEIKDDETLTPMVPISTVVDGIAERQPSLQSFGSQPSLPLTDLSSDDAQLPVANSNLTYQQAMRVGFAAGVVVALIIGAYLLFHK